MQHKENENKWPQPDVDHCHTSSVEFKNKWSCTSILHLRGVLFTHRDNSKIESDVMKNFLTM
jgi:hypothetical protein